MDNFDRAALVAPFVDTGVFFLLNTFVFHLHQPLSIVGWALSEILVIVVIVVIVIIEHHRNSR